MSNVTNAYARLEGSVLTLGNGLIERWWQVRDGLLFAASLHDKRTGREWVTETASHSTLWPHPSRHLTLTTQRLSTPVSAEFLQCELQGDGVTYRFEIFDDLPAITMQLITTAGIAGHSASSSESITTGIETSGPAAASPQQQDEVDSLPVHCLHCDFVAVEMGEQTDGRDNLVFERRWMVHPSERHARAAGNLFALEHRQSGEGMAILKHAPAPICRPVKTDWDCALTGGTLLLHGHGLGSEGGEGYRHTVLLYSGGKTGRTIALQQLQQHLRVYRPGRDGAFVSNTWGDRNRDAALCERFMLEEAKAAARLGVDVTQIDDGWQKGRSANSATSGGVWNGFWASDPQFWTAHPARFPNGLEPIASALQGSGLSLGLWYAPDSSNECVNWKRDAEQILSLYRTYGVRHVKIDAVKIHSRPAELNVRRFYEYVLEQSRGEICFDADVTAEIRPGFWGLMHTGAVFVENRYTDWHNYWPHHTLRNLWNLAHYIPPVRLRMEMLNVDRNRPKYAGDPLAPEHYSPDTLFAMVMLSSPLGWFEVSHLPEAYFAKMAPLVQLWKQHRAAIHRSPVVPIGQEPDGFAWTGLRTCNGSGTEYAVVFNELSQQEQFTIPNLGQRIQGVRLLHGDAEARHEHEQIVVRIHRPLGHAFLALQTHV